MITDSFSLLFCLQLIRSQNIGPITFWHLVRRFGSPKSAIDALEQGVLEKKVALLPLQEAKKEIDQHQKRGIHLISAYDPFFPSSLKFLPDCPPVLSVRGQLDVLKKEKKIALVGSRNASLNGRYFAKKLASDLGDQEWITVSGLARGIDGSVHLGSLRQGTIAVLAGGVDVIYPLEHTSLYSQIQETGCIISEMPLQMAPTSTHFPRRNRLISGLSQGVVVIEAALKSGSLITANCALDQGREVFAVPGSPLDPRSRGTNDLLRAGAHVVESVLDILSVLENSFPPSLFKEPPPSPIEGEKRDSHPSSSLAQEIFNALSTNPIAIETLADQYRCSIPDLLSIILELELEGLVVRSAHGMVSRGEKGMNTRDY